LTASASRLDGAACFVQIGGVMSSASFDPEGLIDAATPLLGLTLTPESRAQTALHLRIAAQQAEKLFSIALDGADEPAPVFTA
jgi:hypothetical protein